jgi:hypothetical protein
MSENPYEPPATPAPRAEPKLRRSLSQWIWFVLIVWVLIAILRSLLLPAVHQVT